MLIDTNILVSAALFPHSNPFKACGKAVSYPYQAIVCEQNTDEIKRISYRKFPDRIEALDVVPIPDVEDSKEKIRDYQPKKHEV